MGGAGGVAAEVEGYDAGLIGGGGGVGQGEGEGGEGNGGGGAPVDLGGGGSVTTWLGGWR